MHGMSHLKAIDEELNINLDFQWGKKREVGASTDVQFYDSFTYDGVDYSMFDCVYMWRDQQAEPEIGVIVKIWETPSYVKKVKVVWFFRPSDISNFMGDDKPLKNEIFLASGEGKGLADLNPLLAIAGKCNVVCTSKNKSNPQASDAELRMADFIFYRNFDVGTYMLSDKFPDRIAGIKVECFYNKKEDQKPVSDPKIKQNSKERAEKLSLFSQPVLNEKMGNWKSSSLSSTENQPFKKRKPLSDFGDSLQEPPSNVSASKPGEGSCANFMQSSRLPDCKDILTKLSDPIPRLPDCKDIRFKDILTKLSDPIPRLPDCKEIAFDAKTLCSQSSGLCKGVIERACNISHKSSSPLAQDNGIKPENQLFEVTRRSNADTKRWFKQLPWEERMKNAHEQGTLVFLENLDPSYTSSEVEDIVWQALNEKVDAKMIKSSTFSSPHSGKAFVIFKSKVAADTAINNLRRRCLILPTVRPLIAYIRTPTEPDKAAKLVGHLELDRTRIQKQRKDMRDAVATSHCSQSNNIEYDLAVKWRYLQEQTDAWWNALHKKQASELKELKSYLKYTPNVN